MFLEFSIGELCEKLSLSFRLSLKSDCSSGPYTWRRVTFCLYLQRTPIVGDQQKRKSWFYVGWIGNARLKMALKGSGYLKGAGYLTTAGCLKDAGYLKGAGYLKCAGYLKGAGYLKWTGYLKDAGYSKGAGYLKCTGYLKGAGYLREIYVRPV